MSDTKIERQLLQILSGTVHQVVNAFLVDRKSQSISPRTVRTYKYELGYFLKFLDDQGVLSMEELTPNVIRMYLLQLAERRNPGGCHIAYRIIRTLTYWWEVETDGEYVSPIRKVKPPKVNKQIMPGVPLEDVRLMIQSCKGDLAKRDRALLMCLLDTGCRAAEFLSLNIGHVDFISGSVIVERGKGGKSRMVYLGSKSRRSLRAYLKIQTDLTPGAPLWATKHGDRLTQAGLRQILKRRAQAAGVPVPGAHKFRRAFALSMLRAGTDLETLRQIMGHASLEVLARYLELIDDDLQAAHRQNSPIDREF
jgi:integrase/recombinase XerD